MHRRVVGLLGRLVSLVIRLLGSHIDNWGQNCRLEE